MRATLTGLIWIVLMTLMIADPVRVAIISDSGSRNLSELVTTELSSNVAISLLERDDLAKIGDEAKVQQMAGSDATALGKLANADGLLFLDQRADGVHVRFTAVNLGYALFDDSVPSGADLQQEAKALAHLVDNDVPKLKLDPSKAVPISLLNLRADIGTPESMSLERKLTLLLESRLAAVPEYVVLERRHAWSLGFEHSLDPATKPLLHEAYLIDGALSLTPGAADTCKIAVRIRSPDGKEADASAQGNPDNLADLVDQMIDGIQKAIGRTVSPPIATPTTEAGEYLREALWGWRSQEAEPALEAVDSAELLGADAGDVTPLRIQILCALADRGMERWEPGVETDIPSFDATTLSAKVDFLMRAIPDAVHYRDDHLESKLHDLAEASWEEKYFFRTDQTIAKVAFIGSKTLRLLEIAQSPRAEELRQALRVMAGYDPLHGHDGWLPVAILANNGDCTDVFTDDLAESMDEEIAWYKMRFVDGQVYTPRYVLGNPDSNFCPRFLTTQEARKAGFTAFVESLKNEPQSQRIYFILRAGDPDPKVADAVYRAYLDLLWPMRDELGSTEDYTPIFGDYWRIPGGIVSRNAAAGLPLLHSLLNAPHPGRWGLDLIKMLWVPSQMTPTDASVLWTELNGYKVRRNDVVTQKEGRPDNTMLAEVEQLADPFRNKFPEIASAPLPPLPGSAPAAAPLVVTRFWYPWLVPDSPAGNNFLTSYWSVCPDGLWLAGYFNLAEKAQLFHIHLPEMDTLAIDPPDKKPTQGILWTPKGLLATAREGEVSGGNGGFYNELALYDPTTASWSKRRLAVTFLPQPFWVNGKIYVAIAAMGKSYSDRESGVAKYDWEADKLTLLADNRRRPAQNSFDDTAPYRITAIFPGPGNKPAITTDSGTYYIEETPGPWANVFDSRFNDQVVRSVDQSIIFNDMGEMTLIDPALTAPVPWMAASQPIWRKPKSTTNPNPVPTPWAGQAIWDCPSGKQKGMSAYTVAFNSDRVFIIAKPSPVRDDYELICYDKSRGRNPVHMALKFQLTEAAKVALSQVPGHMPNGWTLDELTHPLNGFQIIATPQGLCLKLMCAGFWFIPYSDIDAYLKANR
jgi:hypothetical protein